MVGDGRDPRLLSASQDDGCPWRGGEQLLGVIISSHCSKPQRKKGRREGARAYEKNLDIPRTMTREGRGKGMGLSRVAHTSDAMNEERKKEGKRDGGEDG